MRPSLIYSDQFRDDLDEVPGTSPKVSPVPGYEIAHDEVDGELRRINAVTDDGRPTLAGYLALARSNAQVSVSDLRNNLGLDSDDCRDILAQLVTDGLLVGVADGPYVLADLSKTIDGTASTCGCSCLVAGGLTRPPVPGGGSRARGPSS